ncbi:hypothetical protein EGW08_009605, partial [Elysia chlorotica]
MSGQFKSFVTEEEVNEQRQKRQAEWEKVRKPEDPEECPEEETRSLFDQLKSNQDYAEREREEETKLRNSVKGLDDDEVQFLNFVSNRQLQIEKDRNTEEKSVIAEVQEKAGQTSASKETPQSSTNPSISSNRNSQRLLLQGAIKRKRYPSYENNERPDAKLMAGLTQTNGSTILVAGILPGIADYAENDSSTENESNSSDSEADHQIAPSVITRRVVQEMMQKLKNDES